jgi:hypothetical protein
MNIAFAILAVLGVIAAVVGVARFTEGGARNTRILLCLPRGGAGRRRPVRHRAP